MVGQTQQIENQCSCSQLTTLLDCQANKSLNCSWDSDKLVCSTQSIKPIEKPVPSFCDNLNQEKCLQEKSCTWSKNTCISFTSCTAFAYTTQEECKGVNILCISDGVHCVNKDECSSYKKQNSCQKNMNDQFCYWNQHNSQCEDADTCEKLPVSLKSDLECRSGLQFCTFKINGGCEISPEKCTDHKLESQCTWNKDKSQQCYWNNQSGQCVDRICLNAPTSTITESFCNTFLSDGSCTVKKGGGCRIRTTCQEADVQDSCKKNNKGQDCFWDGTNCLLKICSNALNTLTTNDQCNQFIQGCITKTGGGCVENGECIVATLKEACVKNVKGQDCYWNSEKKQCLDLKCSSAPSSMTTHDECTTFLSTCTKKAGGGCENRNCSNAPNSMNSNTLCEAYYPNNKCITKKDGGCTINTICSDITISQACDKDANNKQCFWDDQSKQCKDKICSNAPTGTNTHELCQQFMNECTVNNTNDGCVDKTCGNLLTQNICDKDLNNQLCIWKGQCYKKQCSYASQTITTNEECFSYSSDCILHNDGYGCTKIVMQCKDILKEKACKFILKVTNGIKTYPECDWKNSQCQDKTCLSAPNTINTTTQCNQYLQNCVANNPVNGQIKGCQELPKNCNQRLSSENCKITRVNYPDCIWDNANGLCLQKSCLTANISGDNESLNTFTFASCKGYLSQCIPNSKLPNSDGCIDKPQSCNGLTVNNCKDEAKINGNCYWNGSNCNDKKCENLGLTTYAACSSILDTCTVAADLQNCMTLANDCSEYTKEEQCKFIVNKYNCIWTNNQCKNSTCSDAKNDVYNTEDKCSNFLVKNDKCTISDVVDSGVHSGCIAKQNSCNLYTVQTQCYSTLSGDTCIWINNQCKSKSIYATGECSLFKGTQSDCEQYRLGCSNVANATSSNFCIVDCTKFQKAQLKLSDCTGFHQSCSVNSEGNKCVNNQAECSSYQNSSDCYKATNGYCVFISTQCKNIATAAECSNVKQSNLDDAKCKIFNSSCTVNNAKTECQERKATCDLYNTQSNCTISTAKHCLWNGTQCKTIQNAQQQEQCSLIVGQVGKITNNYCNSIHTNCTKNSDASSCQRIKDNCNLYLTQQSCSISTNDGHCIWLNNACKKPSDPSTDCVAITISSINEDGCSTVLANCIENNSKTQCHQKQSTCSLYVTQETCTISNESQPKCVWDGSVTSENCKSFSTASDCQNISSSKYTQEICTAFSSLCVLGKNKCQENKSNCLEYTDSDSCTYSDGIKCFWYQNQCQNLINCDIIKGTNLKHSQCQQYNSSCTNKLDGKSCQTKQNSCESYSTENDCTRSDNQENQRQFCFWQGQCNSFDIASDCNQKTGVNLTDSDFSVVCTALLDGTGYQEKMSTCDSYTSQNTCTSSFDNGKCFWNTSTTPNKCDYFKETFDCQNITGTNLKYDDCQQYDSNCFINNNGTGCYGIYSYCEDNTQNICNYSAFEKGCYWDTGQASCVMINTCSDVKGRINLTNAICRLYSQAETCVANYDGTACQKEKDYCSDNKIQLECTEAGNSGRCYYADNVCRSIDSSSDCSIIINQTNLTDSQCKGYNSSCTSNRIGTACQQIKDKCKDYSDENSCAQSTSDGYCFWYATQNKCIKILAKSECSLITGQNLTDKECKLYNSFCTSNRAGTACQLKLDLCYDYQTEESCVLSNKQKYCIWDGGCLDVQIAQDCNLISYIPNITNSDCQAILSSCIVNLTNTGCQEQKSTCSEYDSNHCSFTAAKKCFKQTFTDSSISCIQIDTPSSDCQKITGTNLTSDDCNSYHSGCTVNADKTRCQQQLTNCTDYSEQSQCTKSTNGYCYWSNSACIKITGELQESECLAVTGTNLKHEDCQSYNVGCTSNKAGDKCIELKSDCSSYSTSDDCSQISTKKCFYSTSTCKPIALGTDCPLIVDASNELTYDKCQFYHSSCSVNFNGSACVEMQSNCSSYNATQCYKSSSSQCIVQSSNCVDASQATNCLSIGINQYSDENCKAIKSNCIENATNNGCTDRTCLNYTGATFNHKDCNDWLSECTVNANNDGCITMPANCTSQTTSCIQSVLGRCILINGTCTLRACNQTTQDANFDTDQECSDYLQTCTAAIVGSVGGGCQPRKNCNQYLSESICTLNNQGNKCFWNQTDQNCVDLKCENIEYSNLYNTHDKCYAIDNQTLKCTIRQVNGSIAKGCQIRGDCNSYKIREQCVIDQNDKICAWNTNLNIPACDLKSCTTAAISITTHTECLNYYSEAQVSCTVHAKQNTDLTISLGGCQQTVQCNQYIHQEQCQINNKGEICGWNGTKCDIKSCATAPPETDDDQKCKSYFDNTCTVNDSGQGCRTIPDLCEGMTEKQCIKNKNGDPCNWDGTQCITKTCENAPNTLLTAVECNQYLEGCTIDEIVKCKLKPCEEFLFSTDESCKQAMSQCTSNGSHCVERGKCSDAAQAGCVVSQNNEQCEWVVGQQKSYCAIKSCETAPTSNTTDSQCNNYFTNCTTKLGGGCTKKSTCMAATVKDACISALDGTLCGWNEDSNQCSNKDCQHQNGTTHQICNQYKQTCTVGLKGKCAKMQECESTTIKDACIVGLNGNCKWIEGYQNLDGTKGACFKYENCESFQWTTDEECKLISNQCTTDGTKCVGITLCSETNITGGCKTGTDGQCIQSIPSLNSTEQETCKLFTSCSDAYYLTHEQCQKANMNCTTNGQTGCINLTKCSSYTSKLGCVINDIGVIQKDAQVTSTGKCQWENETCRDQLCKDLIGSTHQSCQDQIYNCTTDGVTCIIQDKCTVYNNENSCFKGTDGFCQWEKASDQNNNKGSCRIKKCSDIVDGKTFEQCQVMPQCITDGLACIQKDKCSTYTTKIACNLGGTEGLCVFKQSTAQNAVIGVGTCSSMSSCTDASNDQVACLQAKDRCQWILSENKCSPHTCDSYKSTNSVCHSFYDWSQSKITYCSEINGVCTTYDPKTLKQAECYQISEYTYYWNNVTNSCSSCLNQTSNGTSIQNSENSTQTGQGTLYTIFILAILVTV